MKTWLKTLLWLVLLAGVGYTAVHFLQGRDGTGSDQPNTGQGWTPKADTTTPRPPADTAGSGTVEDDAGTPHKPPRPPN